MDDLNPDQEDNKIFETEPGDEANAGFSVQTQSDRVLGGSSDNQSPENRKKSIREKTIEFFKTKHATFKLGVVAATIGGVAHAIIYNNPGTAIETSAVILGLFTAIDYVKTRPDSFQEEFRKNEARIKEEKINNPK